MIFFCSFFPIGVHGYHRHPFFETSVWLHGLENVTSADIDNVVSNNWVKLFCRLPRDFQKGDDMGAIIGTPHPQKNPTSYPLTPHSLMHVNTQTNIRHSWRMCKEAVRGERSFLRHYVHIGA